MKQAEAAGGTRRKMGRLGRKNTLIAYSFLAPNFLGFAVFTMLPVLFAIALSDASTDGDMTPTSRRSGTHRNILHGINLSAKSHISSFAYTTCHENDEVGLFYRLHLKRSERLQHANHTFGIMLVHLASKCMDAESKIIQRRIHVQTHVAEITTVHSKQQDYAAPRRSE